MTHKHRSGKRGRTLMGVRVHMRGWLEKFQKRLSEARPATVIVLGFAFMVFVGTVLLSLPISSSSGRATSLPDAFFSATSAVCITGFTVLPTATYWSGFGQVVILILIQLGGLGIMTIVAAAMMLAGRKITLRERMVIQASFNQTGLSGAAQLVKYVVTGTVLLEGSAAVIFIFSFLIRGASFYDAFRYGVFHAVSAFCNAGFDILEGINIAKYAGGPVAGTVTMLLITAGGIGFVVWVELVNLCKIRKKTPGLTLRRAAGTLSLHSKIVFLFSGILLAVGTVFYFFAEYNNPGTIGNLPWYQKLWAALLQSVNARTAGFAYLDQAALTPDSKFMGILLMFIGASPAGTGGGVKTVTVAVIAFTVISVLRGRESINAFGRSIGLEYLQKSLAILFMLLGVVIVATMALNFTESFPGFTFLDILYEVVAAASTAGFSTGLSARLTLPGKMIIALCMFIGRLGPVTVVVALTMKLSSNNSNIRYPNEKVVIG